MAHFVDMYVSGEVVLDDLVSHRLTHDEINRGFDMMRSGESVRSVVVYARAPLGSRRYYDHNILAEPGRPRRHAGGRRPPVRQPLRHHPGAGDRAPGRPDQAGVCRLPGPQAEAARPGRGAAATLFGIQAYIAEQLGLRKSADCTFMIVGMVPEGVSSSDVAAYYAALRRAQHDVDLHHQRYVRFYLNEINAARLPGR